MNVVAISVKGKEYLYKASSAHKVAPQYAEQICEALNKNKFRLNEGEVWYPHEVENWSNGWAYAEIQSFRVVSGSIVERR